MLSASSRPKKSGTSSWTGAARKATGRRGNAGARLGKDGHLLHQFPKEHWKHLRTTNVVESPFAALRLRTNAAKRYKKVENATGVIWKMLMLAERRFRRLDAPEKLMQVYLGFGTEEARDDTEIKREEVLAVA